MSIQYIHNTYTIHTQYIYNTCAIHVQYIHNTFIPPPPPPTAVPKLSQVQDTAYQLKLKKVAGLQLEKRYELLSFCQKLLLPPVAECRQLVTNPSAEAAVTLMGKQYLCIPQDAAAFGVDGACFTGPTQITWMGQLLKQPKKFVLHMDGKYKLHHGVWILISVGTHMLKATGETPATTKLSNTFVPLVYLFCKNHESNGEDIEDYKHQYTKYIPNTHQIHTEYIPNTHQIHTEYISDAHLCP